MADPKTLPAPAFAFDEAAGDHGIHAAHSLLSALGVDTSYPILKAISGDGFRTAYSPLPTHEPLFALSPNDFLRDAFAFYGIEGRWHLHYDLDEAWDTLQRSLDEGWPLITSHLSPDLPGYQLIVGASDDDGRRRVALQGARLPRDLEEDPEPAPLWEDWGVEWNGPVSSRPRWGIAPLFALSSVGKPDKNTYASRTDAAITRGLANLEVFEIPFSDSDLELTEDDLQLAGQTAGHGLDAWPTLEEDIAKRHDLTERFDFISRVYTFARVVQHNRHHLADFFDDHAKRLKGQRAKDVTTLAEHLAATRDAADTLARLAWNTATLEARNVEEFQERLAADASLANPIPPELDELTDDLAHLGYDDRIHTTTWGDAVLMPDALRWRALAQQTRTLSDLEFDTEAAIRDLSGFSDDL